MKPHLLAAELARIVPDLAKDCVVNRETVIRNMIENHLTPPAEASHNAPTTAPAPAGNVRQASL